MTDAAGQKEPAGHGNCCLLGLLAVAHTKPATHWFVRSAVFASAKHEPAVHAVQLASAENDAPPEDHVPAGHGFEVFAD